MCEILWMCVRFCATFCAYVWECVRHDSCTSRTKSFIESIGCRTRPLERVGIDSGLLIIIRNRPWFTFYWYKSEMRVRSELMVQINQRGGTGVETPPPRRFVGGVTRLRHTLHVCDMSHSCAWHNSFVCVTWIIHVYHAWLIHVYDITHSYVWHE